MRIKNFKNYIKEEINSEELDSDNQYIGNILLNELAEKLGVEVIDNHVEYNGKIINFYSETEMFHVDKKRFKTVEEVVDYLTK